MTVTALAKNLPGSQLKQIKSECGGLKTLLRNKHEIFEFINKDDIVRIRKPQPQNSRKPIKQQTIRKRQCFFYYNHPQGCPLSADECTFLHNTQ